MKNKIKEMSDDELELELQNRRKKKKKQQEEARKKYEEGRDLFIGDMMAQAAQLSQDLADFKMRCHDEINKQQELLAEYGGIRKNSKGGFSITSSDGQFRITRRRDTIPHWDERAEKATALISEFLRDTIKKREKDLFEILMGFLERNMKGDLEYAKVFHLIKYQNRFEDRRWIKGLDLLKESYRIQLKSYAYEFKSLDSAGKWQSLDLNFSAV